MSESESENESDLDFSASEDEYVPSADEDSESDDYQNQSIVDEPQPSSSKQKAKGKRKVASRKNTEDDDDSDSSVDNYLVNPNDIDLSSDFFNPTKKIVVPDAPNFDCNVGLKLSDSEEEIFEAVPSTSQAAYVELADFEADQRRQKAIREMVENLKQFEANNYGFGNSEMVRKVLGLGEPALAATKSPQSKRKERLSSSDESDFEEVEEKVTTDKKSDVEVRIEPANKQKVNKLQAEIEASIKRKINRRKKESQLMMHKVHVLSWIAYGNYVNKILNSTKLMEMVVKYIPSEKCYPKEKTDEQFFQQIVKWYKTTVGLKSNEQNCPLKCLPPIATSLALQIQSKMAICKKDFVFVFIILLRSMGIQCRLVINLATVPMRPAVKDLCVISTKTADKPAKSSSGDKAKTDKKSKKTAKVSSQDKNVVKGSTASKTKLKSRANSISGTKSEIVMEEDSNRNQTMEPVVDKKKKLKRSVSVQSSSSINDNNKRSRSSSKANIAPKLGSSTKNGTNATVNNQTASVQKPTSTTSEASKLTFNEQKSIPSTETDTVRPRISNRTRQILARKSSGAVLSNIPQLDGGDDKKSKKPKANLFKIRLPPRARSVSPSSSGAASVKPSRGRAQSSAPKSIPQPDSTSAASEHAVRKSELDKSNDSAPSAAESLPKSEMSLSEPKSPKSGAPEAPSATTSKPKRRTLYTSPTKTWLHHDRPKTVVAKHQKVADTQPVQLGSSTESTTKSLSLSKQAANTDKKSPSASPSKLAASSKRSNSKTKSSNPAKKLRSQSVEPSANVAAATVSPSKSSKESNPKTKLSQDKKLRSRSKEPAAIPITATESTASSKKSNSKTKSSNPEKGRRSKSAEPSADATVSSSQDKKLRSRSKESAPPTATTTESTTKSATSSKRSKSKTKSSNPAKKLRSKSVEPSANVATASTSKSSASSKRSNSKTKSSDPAAGPSMNSSKPSSSSKQSKSKPNAKSSTVETPMKTVLKRKATISISSDSDFAPTPKKKLSTAGDRPLPKQVDKLKKRIDRRILSSDDESVEPAVKKEDMNYWIEVYCEAESKWICIDLFKMKVNCVDEVKKKATKPIAYVFAWNNNNKIKDVSPRYCSQWNTTTRKLRVQPDWLDEALSRYKEPLSQRCVAEDRELQEIHAQTPIPSSISELKNHPLYVLPRHLLKFEGIYPPNPVPVGFIREEPIYSRLCVHTLHSREIWVKQARVVKPGENPYKIVKARPKWDRLANKMLECQPLEIFGRWQTEPYVPPTAENGIVPRNAYGNVELFKPEMLPKKTVHLRLAGLNRVCAKLKIDCAQAVVGFDFHGGSSHPTFDGFVVCEEFAELVTERWCEEQEEAHRKAKEKQNQRVYDNWKKLVKGLLIRERLQRKYNFAGKIESKGT